MYQRHFKRALDITLSLMAFIALLPVMMLVALWVAIDSPGPLLFHQKRVGKDKAHFMIHKFRTMRVDTPCDTPTHLLKGATSHITRAGRFLRASSLDELPQLWNILTGEMSVIGPRPALWNQYDLIAERDKYGANALKPGLTGWAQVHGRDELPIAQKAALDGEYAKNVTLKMDIRCVLLTVRAVFRRDGYSEGGPNAPSSHK